MSIFAFTRVFAAAGSFAAVNVLCEASACTSGNWTGTSAAETMIGCDDYNEFFGGDGNDDLSGGGGDDFLNGEGGDDTLRGDDGVDILFGGPGDDWIYGGPGGPDEILSGDDGNDHLFGEADDDIMRGGKGIDAFDGGLGFNRISFINEREALSGAVVDLNLATKQIVNDGYNNAETIAKAGGVSTVQGLGAGTPLADTFKGTSLANWLSGGGGDTLEGRGGNDEFYLGSRNATDGPMTVNGGAGTDTVVGFTRSRWTLLNGMWKTQTQSANTGVVVNLASQTITDDGWGTLSPPSSITNIENLNGSVGDDKLTGSNSANALNGMQGNDIIDGGLGADTMIGGAGDDVFIVAQAGDTVSELPGEGADEVRSSVSFVLGPDVENLTLTGAANRNGTGNLLDNTIVGNVGNNTLIGGGGADTLQGDAGRDRLWGSLNAPDGKGVRFVFLAGSDSPAGTGRDWIMDFSSADGDRIDLAAIDTDPTSLADDPFVIVSSFSPGGPAGQMTITSTGTGALAVSKLRMDTDYDKSADMEIWVYQGGVAVTGADLDL